MSEKTEKADYEIKKDIEKGNFIREDEIRLKEQLENIVDKKESKSVWRYEIEINHLLRRVYKCFSIDNKTMNCEKRLMRKLDELYLTFCKTGNKDYKKVLTESWKRYNQIINQEVPKNNGLIKSKDMDEISTTIYPEEMDMDLLMWNNLINPEE